MKKNRNAFYSNTFLIFAMRFFPSLAGVVVVAAYSRLLSKPTYGQYSYFWLLLNVLYPVACYGLHLLILNYPPAVLQKLYSAVPKKAKVGYQFWIAAIGVVFAILQFLASSVPLFISLSFFIAYAAGFVFESILIVHGRFKILLLSNFLYGLYYVLLHLYWAYSANFSIVLVFASLLAAVVVRTIVYLVVALRYRKRNIATASESKIVESTTSLWLHLGLYDVLQTSSLWIDKVFVAFLFTPAVFADYLNGAMNIPFLPLLLSAAGSAVLLQLAGTKQQEAIANAPGLLRRTGRLLSCIVFPVFFFLLAFNTEVVRLLYSSRYDEAIPIFTISLLILPVRAYNFTSILQQQHKGKLINQGAFGEIVLALLLMYPLYTVLGLKGLALSFVLSTYMQAIYYLYESAMLLQVKIYQLIPLKDWSIKLSLTAAILFLAKMLTVNQISGSVQLIVGSIAMIVLAGGLLWFERRRVVD